MLVQIWQSILLAYTFFICSDILPPHSLRLEEGASWEVSPLAGCVTDNEVGQIRNRGILRVGVKMNVPLIVHSFRYDVDSS